MTRTASRSRFARRRKPDSVPPGRGGGGNERRPLPLPLRLLAMLCAFAFMVVFAVALARVTLQPSPASEALIHTNLRPGRSLQAYLDQPALRDAVRQVGGNLLLGVPFGVLAPVLAPRTRGFVQVLLLTGIVMLMVEFAQGALITGRAFDIDDVILNTSGALIGYLLLGRRLSRAVHARKPRAGAAPEPRAEARPVPEPRSPRRGTVRGRLWSGRAKGGDRAGAESSGTKTGAEA
ncbi:VanZ like family protein [Streptomyces prasinopilosus]|uniref:VanZ like family protein n=1 Tax=Streptomyces prasinopilosus TaxID=67344 RepID=A0A1G6TLD1_9ACTN|nr:VanZ family protein [Streptomyces prasinopilosus]SDD29316.1 VanZ like family protein [Streptomyces prasinopilosus]